MADRLKSVRIDPASLPAATSEVEQERQIAIYDLVEQNVFRPEGANGGPYELAIGLEENRLSFEVTGPEFAHRYLLSLTPLRGVLKDYFLICESYYAAVREATPGQIEAVDMGRRGLHNEGATLLRQRLEGKIDLDHETARRLFTLLCALHRAR
jgi:uncharacterized protein (UPF0262 family)